MADELWNKQASTHPSTRLLKRPRSDYSSSEMPPVYETQGYLGQHDDLAGPRFIKETNDIGSAYDRYLQNVQLSSLGAGEVSRMAGAGLEPLDGGLYAPTYTDSIPMSRSGIAGASLDIQIPDSLPTLPLPPDATSTLFVHGLPLDCKKREVAHIFRPFVGYKEVRLVVKESQRRDDSVVFCFVDFRDPACAATALCALRGYKMDEDDSDSVLRIQFSRSPGVKSATGSRARR